MKQSKNADPVGRPMAVDLEMESDWICTVRGRIVNGHPWLTGLENNGKPISLRRAQTRGLNLAFALDVLRATCGGREPPEWSEWDRANRLDPPPHP